MGVEQSQLLLPVDQVRGRIHVDHDHAGRLLEAVQEDLSYPIGQPHQIFGLHPVFQPRHCRLARQLLLPSADRLHSPIISHSVAVIRIRIAADDLIDPLAQQCYDTMDRTNPSIADTSSELLNPSKRFFKFRYRQEPRIRS